MYLVSNIPVTFLVPAGRNISTKHTVATAEAKLSDKRICAKTSILNKVSKNRFNPLAANFIKTGRGYTPVDSPGITTNYYFHNMYTGAYPYAGGTYVQQNILCTNNATVAYVCIHLSLISSFL